MNKDELFNLLSSHEWREVEFKEARSNVPKSSYETVSAFANTEGGHLVFGVRKEGPDFEIVGVLDVDKVQNDFITSLNPPKVSKVIEVREYLLKQGNEDLIIFYIPESSRVDKPVYLDGDLRRSFIRKGGCDVRCSPEELKRFLNDAASERFDGQAVDCRVAACFDGDALKWYRRMYEGRPGNKSYNGLPDEDFLFELGLLVECSGIWMPTQAAILLFGRDGMFRQLLPRPVVDCQRFNIKMDDAPTAQRWIDRVVIDQNLVNAWRILLDWYMKLSEHPFKIDPVTLQRDDEPPDYIAFRESAINLLIHQDYADHSRKPEIRHYLDRTIFWNPGDAFGDNIDLLEPGEKEVRNPRIVTAFRRIGLSEHAGWGLREVFRNWQQLGNIPPQITNDKTKKTFELTLLKELLLSEEQLLFQSVLGVNLTELEARAFAYVCRKREVTLSELKAITNLGGPEARKIADRLCVQVLLKPIKEGENYTIADHLRDRFLPKEDSIAAEQGRPEATDLLREQVGARPANLLREQVGENAADLYTEQVGKSAADLLTEQVDARQAGLLREQVDENQVDLSREQVGERPADLLREQVGENEVDLLTEQVDAGQTDLLREQVDKKQVDLSREQVGDRSADLLTEQVGGRAADLLTEQVGAGQADLLREQVGGRAADLCPEQVGPLKSLSETQWRIVALCEVPRTLAEMMKEIGVGSRHYFKTRHLDTLIKSNVIKMTNPENPRASNQKYVLTETGIQLKINKPNGKS
jgi:ATP-dependent DNA helicase RecG